MFVKTFIAFGKSKATFLLLCWSLRMVIIVQVLMHQPVSGFH